MDNGFDAILWLILVCAGVAGVIAFFIACDDIRTMKKTMQAIALKMGATAAPPAEPAPPPRVPLTFFGNPKTAKSPEVTTLNLK
jgi:hypothetical protein